MERIKTKVEALMPAGTYLLAPDEAKIIDEYRMLILHGFGHIQIDIGEVPKDFKTRTHILVGKSYVFFKEKELPDFIKRAIL